MGNDFTCFRFLVLGFRLFRSNIKINQGRPVFPATKNPKPKTQNQKSNTQAPLL
jgi:hypothetical protein